MPIIAATKHVCSRSRLQRSTRLLASVLRDASSAFSAGATFIRRALFSSARGYLIFPPRCASNFSRPHTLSEPGFQKEWVVGKVLVRRTFGYDLATPAATPRHEGYWFSVGLDAQDRLPPAGLVPAWPSMQPAPPARTAYRVNCVACAEPHCLQKPRRARRRPGNY